MRRWILPLVAGLAAVALVGTSAAAVVQYRQARDATARAEAAEERAADLQERVDALERQLDEAAGSSADTGGEDALGGLLDGLLGDDAPSGMQGLLGELLGGSDGIPGARCLLPDDGGGGLGDLFGDLLGGGGSTAPSNPDALVAQTADEVATRRELAWERDVDVAFLDDRAMRERLQALFDEDHSAEDAEVEGHVLTALGAVPRGSDMAALRRQVLEDQVAGFYDPETGELVVRTPSGEVGPADRITLAHELDHALTDQALGLPDLEAERFEADEDALLATLAVVEGDASLLMNQWALGSLGLGEQMSMAMDPGLLAAQASLDEMPPYLAAELLFPYTVGLDHVCDRWLDGGWGAVDATYENTPDTTATVLWPDHPGRTGDPVALSAPSGFQQAHSTTFGAAQLLWLLQAPGGDPSRALDEAEARARSWGGGRLTLWTDGADAAVGLSLVDGGSGAGPLCGTVTAWYDAAFPDADRREGAGTVTFDGPIQDAVVACAGSAVRLGIAPELADATAIVGT